MSEEKKVQDQETKNANEEINEMIYGENNEPDNRDTVPLNEELDKATEANQELNKDFYGDEELKDSPRSPGSFMNNNTAAINITKKDDERR